VLRAMRTRAKPVDGGWLINGTKIWSTGAHEADRLLVIARTNQGARPAEGVTCFVCDGKADGVTATPIPKLGMRSVGSCEVVFDNVFVPDENLVGELDNGWNQLLATLNNERIMAAAVATGILKGVLDDAVEYADAAGSLREANRSLPGYPARDRRHAHPP